METSWSGAKCDKRLCASCSYHFITDLFTVLILSQDAKGKTILQLKCMLYGKPIISITRDSRCLVIQL